MIYKDNEIEIVENTDSDSEEFNFKKYDITSYPADYNIVTLLDKINKKSIVLPPFQREFVWNEKKQSRLIESFLMGLPVPQIFLFQKIDDKHLYIIDGFQRIRSIELFHNNSLKLNGINPAWNGKYFKNLDEVDRENFDSTTMRSIIIRQITPNNENSSMFHIFERLNTGGSILTPMEIRKAIYYGKFYNAINKLNQDKHWRLILGLNNEEKRLRDEEWILRIFALYFDSNKYTAPIKEFLNAFMSNNKNLNDEKLFKKFQEICELIATSIGSKPFHKPEKKLNLAIMDSFMVTLLKCENKINVHEKYEKLLADKDFNESINVRDTTSTTALKNRFKIAKKIICE